MQQVLYLKALRTLFCRSFVGKQVICHKLAARGVILEAGDMLVLLGCLLVKESPLYLSLAGVINFTQKKKKKALADTALSFLQGGVLVSFSSCPGFITLGFSECKISVGIVKFILEGSCSV